MSGRLAVIYFLPWLIAMKPWHHQRNAIGVLNLFLGWTFAGWVAALVWAATETRARETPKRAEKPRDGGGCLPASVFDTKCPHCGAIYNRWKKSCPQCGRLPTARAPRVATIDGRRAIDYRD
jgi:hypothetical protein